MALKKYFILTFNNILFYLILFKFVIMYNISNILQDLGKSLGSVPAYKKRNDMSLCGRKDRYDRLK
jgi:hypothetical protein